MNIPKVGLIERIFKPKKPQTIRQTNSFEIKDEVTISSSALKKFKEGADEKIKQIINNTPDIRLDKVNEVRERLKQGDYYQSVNLDVMAERILRSPFGFQIRPM